MARKPPAPTITPDLLARGWSAPAGGRIRLAVPGDAPDVARLHRLVDDGDQDAKLIADLLADNELGGYLTPALTARGTPASKVLLRQVTEHASTGQWEKLGNGLTFILVACDRQGRVVGTLMITTAKTLLEGLLLQGVDPHMTLMVPVAIAKMRALAVEEESRGLGLGSALVKRAEQLVDALGLFAFYGQISIGDRTLARFYTRCGWQVHEPGESVSLSRLGLPFGVSPQVGERLISRWR